MQGIRFTLTGGMALCAVLGNRKRGLGRSLLTGVGFFVISCYVDGIFRIIMRNGAGEEWRILLEGVSIFVSKSIMLVLLMVLNGSWHVGEGRGQLELTGKGLQAQDCVKEVMGDVGAAGQRWEPLDSLTLGISLLFGILAWWVQGVGRNPEDLGTALFMAFLLAALTGYYGACWFYGRRLRSRRVQSEDRTRKAQAAVYLEGVEEHYQRTRELWHDLKNHVNLLSLLLQEGKYRQMADYLRILGEDVDSLTLPEKSGNLVFDAVLTDKAARAKRDQVRLEVSLCDLTGLELGPDEICGLLGNLLDNALEANARVKEGRFLRVACADRRDCYYIKIENASAGGPEGSGGEAVSASSKSDRRNRVGHGLGLRSAERIVHGCGGDLAIESREGCFAVAVRLPKKRDQEMTGRQCAENDKKTAETYSQRK